MSTLLELQQRMAAAVMSPLTHDDEMRREVDGRDVESEVAEYIKPNSKLTSFDRLEIYNRQYWFRILDALAEDFPGVQNVLGTETFHIISKSYLVDHPSSSFTLRNLGQHLPQWLAEHAVDFGNAAQLAHEMAQLEWAHIEAFDSADWPVLAAEEGVQPTSTLTLQPHLRVLRCIYPVDDFRLEVNGQTRNNDEIVPANKRWLEKKLHAHIYIAVHRANYLVHYRRLQAEEYLLLKSLQSGSTLSEAIETAFAESSLPQDQWPEHLNIWFSNWIQLGWFCTEPTK